MSQPKILGNSDLKSDLQLQEYKYVMTFKNDTKKCDDNHIHVLARISAYEELKFKEDERVPITHLLELFSIDDSEVMNWAESTGLPWCDLGYQTTGDIRRDPEAINEVRKFWHFLKDGEDVEFPDCVVHTQYNSNLKAATTVWTYPATVRFGESAFTIGLIKAFRDRECHGMAYEYMNMTPIEGWNRLCNKLHRNNKFYIKLDFNENTVPGWLISIAFDILTVNIDVCHYAGGGIPDARKMYRMYRYIKKYFMHTPIRLPNGTRILKTNGIPGGSKFTHLIGSVVSAIILEHLSIYIDGTFTEDFVLHGHESIARIKSYWDLNLCREVLMKDYGMTLNLPKCQISKNIKCIHFFKKSLDS